MRRKDRPITYDKFDCACNHYYDPGVHVDHCPNYHFDASIDYVFDRRRVNNNVDPTAINHIYDWRGFFDN